MRKNLIIAAIALLTTAGVTATVLETGRKTATKNPVQKECPYQKHCTRNCSRSV